MNAYVVMDRNNISKINVELFLSIRIHPWKIVLIVLVSALYNYIGQCIDCLQSVSLIIITVEVYKYNSYYNLMLIHFVFCTVVGETMKNQSQCE